MATAAITNQTALTVSPRKTASTPSAYAPASATASQARARTGASVHLAAARDGQRDAGHVLGAAEVDGRVGDLLGRLLALEIGEALHEVLEDAVLRHTGQSGQRGVQHLRPHRRLDVARAERVDGDVHRPELLGERLRERDDRGLGGAVGGEPAAARLPRHRGDVHDPPAAAQPQERDGRACAEEDALHVDGEDAVPLRLVHGDNGGGGDDAGVGDQDVEAAEGLLHRGHEPRHLRGGGDVGGDSDAAVAVVQDRTRRRVEVVGRGERVRRGAVGRPRDVRHRDLAARPGQGHGDGVPEAPGGTGDEGDLAVELHGRVLTSGYRIASSPVMSRPTMSVCMSYVPRPDPLATRGVARPQAGSYKLDSRSITRHISVHLETLKVFCDVVETRSFSTAASQNFVTQSAVSQQIRTLEDRYGRRLLERPRGNVPLTPAGEILYQVSKEIVQRYQDMEARLQALANVITGTVRVATVHSIGLYELSAQIKRYLKAYPQVHLHLAYSRSSRIYED